MKGWVAVWCRCGGSMKAKSTPASVAQNIAATWRQGHAEAGCEITDDPETGRKWRAAAVRRERKAVV